MEKAILDHILCDEDGKPIIINYPLSILKDSVEYLMALSKEKKQMYPDLSEDLLIDACKQTIRNILEKDLDIKEDKMFGYLKNSIKNTIKNEVRRQVVLLKQKKISDHVYKYKILYSEQCEQNYYPYRKIVNKDFYNRIKGYLTKFKKYERQAFFMLYQDRYSLRSIAGVLGKTVYTIDRATKNIMKEVRKKFIS